MHGTSGHSVVSTTSAKYRQYKYLEIKCVHGQRIVPQHANILCTSRKYIKGKITALIKTFQT